MSKIYRNRLVVNQRGGSIVINNTTDNESVQLSHRSGSNVLMNNVVSSELATNNKQLNVVHDKFETTGGDNTEFVGGVNTTRTGNTSYSLDGFKTQSELDAFTEWKLTYEPIAKLNAKFKIKRGGKGYPNGETVSPSGTRMDNPVVGSKVYVVDNTYHGYKSTPVRKHAVDQVTDYTPVPDHGHTKPAAEQKIQVSDVAKSGGASGSSAPGVLEFGASKSAATENGTWEIDTDVSQIPDKILELQPTLTKIEQKMGDGGDKILSTKRDSFEVVGTVFNDYPSVKIDEKGRSQPLEMLVSDTGAFKNHDYIPHVEDVDNATVFPGGNKTVVACNSYTMNVGSGGISMKTTGPVEMGGSTLKMGFKKINMNASHGVSIASESSVEIQSLKTITLRTNRQVYVEGAFGTRNNVIVGGGLYVEGETYLQHVTAPLEVQQTQDTTLFAKFATDSDKSLVIGEANIGGTWYPVYAKASQDLIIAPPHSHHFNNLPLRLTKSNKDVRKFAQIDKINAHDNISQALAQNHQRKVEESA